MTTSVAAMVRESTKNDLAGIVRLLARLSPPRAGEETGPAALRAALARIRGNPDYCLCVAEREGEPVGTATLLVQHNLSHGCRPYGHIENVVTDDRFRGNGIGREMIAFLVARAGDRGCYKVILNCGAHNVPFYLRCGFRVTGELEMRLDP